MDGIQTSQPGDVCLTDDGAYLESLSNVENLTSGQASRARSQQGWIAEHPGMGASIIPGVN